MRKEILLIAIILCIPGAVFAKDPKGGPRELVKKEKKLEDIKKRLRETKSSISRVEAKEAGILSGLERVNIKLKNNRDRLKTANSSLRKTESGISSADAGIKILEQEREELKRRLTARLGAMYKMMSGGVFKAVFSAYDSSSQTEKRYRYLSIIMDSDRKLMEGAKRNIGELAKQKERFSNLKQDLRLTLATAGIEKKEIEKTLNEKQRILSSTRREKDRYLAMAKELEDAQKEVFLLIEKLRKEGEKADETSGFSAMKGKLPMPVSGKVVSYYGKVVHPKFNTVTFNNGIVIEAPFGSEVKSVYKGKVVYVGRLKGYGEVLIIDHQGGFYTLFAHLSEAVKKKNAAVEKGDVVGLVGDSGLRQLSGLYFEIRQKGVPRDPMTWIAER